MQPLLDPRLTTALFWLTALAMILIGLLLGIGMWGCAPLVQVGPKTLPSMGQAACQARPALPPWPDLPAANPMPCGVPGAALCFDSANARALQARLSMEYAAARQARCVAGEKASCDWFDGKH